MPNKVVSITDPTIEDFVKIPFLVYSVVGVKLFKWHSEERMTRREKFSISFAIVNATLNFFAMVGHFFQEFEDTVEFTALIIYLVFACNSIFKMISVWLGRHTLRDIFWDMNKTFPRTERQRQEYRVREYYANINQYMKFVIGFHAAAAMMFILFPITQSLVEFFSHRNQHDESDAGGGFNYRFPYIMAYPFNENRPLTFLLAYFTQFVAGFTCSGFFLGSDLMLLVTVHLLNMQFEYLTHRIERFNSKNIEADLRELIEVLKFHNRILEFSERINNVFNVSILLNYMSTSTCLCLVGFQLSAGSGVLDLSKFITFLVSAALHIYYICYFGQKLTDLSEGLSDALAGHQWYNAQVRYQRMLPIAIARAQRPAFLSAYKFFRITMESFSNLMTTSYRVFTLIKSRYEETN